MKTASRRIGVENRKSKEAQKIPQSPLADKGRNIHKKTVEVSDGEISETEGRAGPSKPATPVAGRQALGGSFQAPRARMYPTPTPQPQANTAEEQGPILPRADPSHVATTHDELYADPPPKSKSPPSASKRKSFDGASESNRGKLPKVKNHWRGTIPEMLKNRQEDAYSVPQSPPPASDPSLHPFPKFGRRKQRESTQDSDPTYVPSREGSIESEAEPDPDSSMTEAPGKCYTLSFTCASAHTMTDLSQRNAEEQGHPLTFGHHILSTSTHRDSTYGPVQRDSVIPDTPDIGTPMPMPIDLTDDEPPPRDSTTVEPPPVARTPLTSTTMAPPSNPSLRKEKELRRELFKLLLSRLNNISPFEPGSKDHEAEGRLNQLLLHFWLNDKATIQRKLGDRFDRLYAAFDSWMDMRRRLYAFQTSTGYFGDPGEEWRLHLRGLGLGSKERAEAVIALVDLVDSEKNGRQYVGETFNDALATLFDQLTLFPACNGAEEFKGVERYNETLLQWFTQL